MPTSRARLAASPATHNICMLVWQAEKLDSGRHTLEINVQSLVCGEDRCSEVCLPIAGWIITVDHEKVDVHTRTV